jgi:hypothetical protein
VAADQSELAGGNWWFSFAKRQLILFQASNASRSSGVKGRVLPALPVTKVLGEVNVSRESSRSFGRQD